MVPPTSISLVIPSEIRLVDVVHTAAERVAEIAGFDEDGALNVALAVRETVINAITHGNGRDPDLRVEVEVEADDRRLRATVVDQGAGFRPEDTPDPTASENLLRSSGRGLLLVRAFVDEVRFRRVDGRGMEVTLVKYLTDGPKAAGNGGRPDAEERRTER